MTEIDLLNLRKQMSIEKMKLLCEEPCPMYEPEWEDVTESAEQWEAFWYDEDLGEEELDGQQC